MDTYRDPSAYSSIHVNLCNTNNSLSGQHVTHTSCPLKALSMKDFENTVEKGKEMLVISIFPFPTMLSPLQKTNFSS